MDRNPDFEPMDSFEMNLNEYHEENEDVEMESNASNNDSGTFIDSYLLLNVYANAHFIFVIYR